MLVLFRARLRALLTTISPTLAAPRMPGWLRRVGERPRRRERPTFASRAPKSMARVLKQATGRRPQGRLAEGLAGVKRAGRRVLHRN